MTHITYGEHRAIRTDDGQTLEIRLIHGYDAALAIAVDMGGYPAILPAQLITGDGPDRLATPLDWQDGSDMASIADALAASIDPAWWADHGSQDAALLLTLDDVVREVWADAPAGTERTIEEDVQVWATTTMRIAIAKDEPDDSGEMLYTWTTYVREGEDDYWEQLDEMDVGTAAELQTALTAWIEELA